MKTLLATILGTVVSVKERGATAVEYGIMVALIAGVIIAVVSALGGSLTGLYQRIGSKL